MCVCVYVCALVGWPLAGRRLTAALVFDNATGSEIAWQAAKLKKKMICENDGMGERAQAFV